MSFYQLGLSVASSPKPTLYQQGVAIGGFQFWRGIKTPGMIRDEIERIMGEWIATERDLSLELNQRGAYPATGLQDRPADVLPLLNWMNVTFWPAYRNMEGFRNRHQGWFSTWWGDTWDDAQTYQKQLIELRKRAREVGFGLTSSIEPVIQPESSLVGGISSLLWTLVKFSLMGAVIFLAFMFISQRIK